MATSPVEALKNAKTQPWQTIHGLLGHSIGAGPGVNDVNIRGGSGGVTHDRDRGKLSDQEQDKFFVMVREKFKGKPWYTREAGGGCVKYSLAYDNTTPRTFPDLDAARHDWERTAHKTTGTARFIAPLLKWDTEKPFNLAFPLPSGQPKTNVITKDHIIPVADARGCEARFSLDVHGFAFATQLPMLSENTLRHDDKDTIAEEDIQQMQDFLRNMLGAKCVQAFDYTFREVKPAGGLYQWHGKRPPARNAHVDQTPESAMSRLRMYYGGQADEVAKGRVRLINLWRPVFGPLEETPLAVLDARSLLEDDLVAQDMVHTHYLGENYVVKFNQNHCWYYWSKMQPNEGILIKNFDW